jgi:Cellulase (glycosyl hydrolase family 5)
MVIYTKEMRFLLILLFKLVLATPPIRCVNFYGIETERKAPVCDWQHDSSWYLQKLKDGYGLNTVRLPYSKEYVSGNDFKKMDAIIDACNKLDIKVILDYHRTYSTHQGKIPTEGITLGQFVDTHVGLLQRYQDKIWGVSVFNEIQITDGAYTNRINHLIVNAIESQFPNKYQYFLGCANWGHDCSEITLPTGFENRSFVDIHQYPFTDAPATRNTTFPSRIPADRYFVGEIGCKDEEIPWLRAYLEYLESRNISNLCFWTIAHSSDTGGLWKDDCETANEAKIDLLADFFNHTERPVPCVRRRQLRRAGGGNPYIEL